MQSDFQCVTVHLQCCSAASLQTGACVCCKLLKQAHASMKGLIVYTVCAGRNASVRILQVECACNINNKNLPQPHAKSVSQKSATPH